MPVLAFAVDSSFSQIAADLLVLIIVGANMWAGWRFGLVRRAIAFASLYAAILGAVYLGNGVVAFIGATNRLYANAWAFVIIFYCVVILFEIMAALYEDRIKNMIVVTFDRVVGLIAGLLVGIFQVGILFLVALAVGDAPAPSVGNNISSDYKATSDAVSNATIGEYIVDLRPGLEALFGPSLPTNLAAHLAEGTTVNPLQR